MLRCPMRAIKSPPRSELLVDAMLGQRACRRPARPRAPPHLPGGSELLPHFLLGQRSLLSDLLVQRSPPSDPACGSELLPQSCLGNELLRITAWCSDLLSDPALLGGRHVVGRLERAQDISFVRERKHRLFRSPATDSAVAGSRATSAVSTRPPPDARSSGFFLVLFARRLAPHSRPRAA